MNGKQVAIIVGIFSALIIILLYGVEYRPLVGYSIKENTIRKEIGTSYKPNLIQQYNLQIMNSGKTDASLILNFFCDNATISNGIKKPYNYINENEFSSFFTVLKDSPQYYTGDNLKITIMINEDAESFSCKYNVLKNPDDSSISGLINRMFGEIKGYYPTSFKYIKINDELIFQE